MSLLSERVDWYFGISFRRSRDVVLGMSSQKGESEFVLAVVVVSMDLSFQHPVPLLT